MPVELVDVCARFGPRPIIYGLNLTIARGECLALLGPSGCGKSTTLNLIAGFLEPAGGSIRIAGRSMAGIPPHRRDTAMVFQNYALFPHLTVGQNIAFGLEMRRRDRAEIRDRVARALDLVRLDGMIDRYPRQLSGGQQQRIAIARALAVAPAVLLLDEPLSNLDARLREEMRAELSELQRRIGLTTLFVTHDQADAMAIADRIAVMRDGRIEQIGSAADLYERPETRFVAGFVGRVNMLPARIAAAHADGTDISLEGGLPTRCRQSVAGRAGEAVTLLIRPEHLRIAAPAAPGIPALPGIVERVSYLGSTIEVSLACGSHALKAVLAGSDGMPAPGAEVLVSWAPEHARLLPGQ